MFRPRSLRSLSFLFPCYNEALNIGSMIEQAAQVAEDYGIEHEIIVVDDGSRDDSRSVVEGLAKRNPRVRLISHEKNLGYGAALRTGLETARMDMVFLADGDDQFRVAEIEKLFAKIDGCDVVTGYRIRRQDGPLRRLNGSLWTWLNRVLFGLPVRDVDCAFKLIRRRCLEGVGLRSDQLLIHSELLARLKKKGCKIQEIGVNHYPRTKGKASATGPGRVLKTFVELVRLYSDIQN